LAPGAPYRGGPAVRHSLTALARLPASRAPPTSTPSSCAPRSSCSSFPCTTTATKFSTHRSPRLDYSGRELLPTFLHRRPAPISPPLLCTGLSAELSARGHGRPLSAAPPETRTTRADSPRLPLSPTVLESENGGRELEPACLRRAPVAALGSALEAGASCSARSLYPSV